MFRDLGIADPGELEATPGSGILRLAPGFGAWLESTVLAGVAAIRARTGRTPIGEALSEARVLLATLRDALPNRTEIAGSVRHIVEAVADIGVVAETLDPESTTAGFGALPTVASLVDRFPGGVRLPLQSDVHVDVFFTPPERIGSTLMRATVSQAHLDLLGKLLNRAYDEDASTPLLPCRKFLPNSGSATWSLSGRPRFPGSSKLRTLAASFTPIPPGATAPARSERWQAQPATEGTSTLLSPTIANALA